MLGHKISNIKQIINIINIINISNKTGLNVWYVRLKLDYRWDPSLQDYVRKYIKMKLCLVDCVW